MEIDFNIVGSVLGSVSIVWNGIQSWMLRQRATQSAIDRVEVKADKLHQDQESRLIRLEENVRHAIGAKELAEALEPIYRISRQSESHIAALQKGLEGLERGQTEIRTLILQRGLEK